jgi:hypothetical protein
MAFRSTAALSAMILCSMTLLALAARPVVQNKATQLLRYSSGLASCWCMRTAAGSYSQLAALTLVL